jgi:hypothetical protein
MIILSISRWSKVQSSWVNLSQVKLSEANQSQWDAEKCLLLQNFSLGADIHTIIYEYLTTIKRLLPVS